ncbi:MAG: hypothetical protein FJ215_01110 [Ignavibacteria bacterium]|nr:hypothetical protein [Ignavibacteria bacterium]
MGPRANYSHVKEFARIVRGEFGTQECHQYFITVFGSFSHRVAERGDSLDHAKFLEAFVPRKKAKPAEPEERISLYTDVNRALDSALARIAFQDTKAPSFPIVLLITDGRLPPSDMGAKQPDPEMYRDSLRRLLVQLDDSAYVAVVLYRTCPEPDTTDLERILPHGLPTFSIYSMSPDSLTPAKQMTNVVRRLYAGADRKRSRKPGQKGLPESVAGLLEADSLPREFGWLKPRETESVSFQKLDSFIRDSTKLLKKFGEVSSDRRLQGQATALDKPGFSRIEIQNAWTTSKATSTPAFTVEATTRFLAERIESELVYLYLERFSDLLRKPPMKTLFPQTLKAVKASTDPEVQLSTSRQPLFVVLRRAVEADLQYFPVHIVEAAAIPPDSTEVTTSHGDAIGTFRRHADVAYKLIKDLLDKGGSLHELLAEIAPDTSETWRALKIVSLVARRISQGGISESSDVNNALSWVILHEFMRDTSVRYCGDLRPIKLETDSILARFGTIIKRGRTAKEKFSIDETNEYFKDVAGIFNAGQKISKIIWNESDYDYSNFLGLCAAAWQRDHGTMLLHLRDVLSDLDVLNSKEFSASMKYIGLVVDLARTSSSEEMNKVLSSYANPPGSYRLKRDGIVSLTVSAYPSARLLWSPRRKDDVSVVGLGFGFPVGIDYVCRSVHSQQFAVFLSAVDFGNPLMLHLRGKSTAAITWESILAPGLVVFVPVGNQTPWGVLLGIFADEVAQEGRLRLQLGFSYDLSLFNVR